MTALMLAEARVPVDLVSLSPAKRAPSVTLVDGVNAASELGEDSPGEHLRDTLSHGGFVANQALVRGMVEAAPNVVDLLDRMGVPFRRTNEGLIERSLSHGSRHPRTAVAGAATGQLILHALDEQIRRLEDEPVIDSDGATLPGEKRVRRFEQWDLLDLVRDSKGNVVGVVAQDLKSMRVRAFPGDAVVLATGDAAGIFGRGAASVQSTGTGLAAAYRAGAAYANADRIEIQPLAIVGPDKLRVIPENILKEGAGLERLVGAAFTPLDLTEADFGAENGIARAIVNACVDEEGRPDEDAAVFLKLPPLAGRVADAFALQKKLGGIGSEVRVFPAVQRALGGLWVDFERDDRGALKIGSARNHATNIPGLYAVGDVQYQYHGKRRLPGNAALACIYSAMLAAPAVRTYRDASSSRVAELPRSIFEKAEKAADESYHRILLQNEGKGDAENAYALADDLRALMFHSLVRERDEKALTTLLEKLGELDDRAKRVRTTDTAARVNQGSPFIRHLENMLSLATVIAASALRRAEDSALRTLLALDGGERPRFVTELSYTSNGETVSATDAIDTTVVPPGE